MLVAVVELVEGLVLHVAAPRKTFAEASWNTIHLHRLQSFQAQVVSEAALVAQQWERRQEQVEAAHESYHTGKDHNHRHQVLVPERLMEELEEVL